MEALLRDGRRTIFGSGSNEWWFGGEPNGNSRFEDEMDSRRSYVGRRM